MMESIEKLRRVSEDRNEWLNLTSHQLWEMADAIERDHRWECTKAWHEGYDSGFASADEWLAHNEDTMAEHGWMKLPVDADGVPIRIGDVIAYKDNTRPKEAVALVPPSVVMVDDGPRYADMCRHYHEPTVEDVLREFADVVRKERIELATISEETIAEYAAKLMLKED